jgi:hypothetical protein
MEWLVSDVEAVHPAELTVLDARLWLRLHDMWW